MRRAALLPGLLLAIVGCGPASAPVERAAWSVEGGFIRDSAGRAVVLRGANVSSVHKQAPYFDFHAADDFRRLREDWGLNSVRFLLTWAAVEPRQGEYDEAYLDEVAARLELAGEAGLLVVLDLHQDVWGEGFAGGDGAPRWTCDEARYAAFQPATPWFLSYLDPNVIACFDGLWKSRSMQQRYGAAWRHLAERLSSDAIIGFDPMNEPFWGSFPMDTFEVRSLAPFYAKVVGEVRAARPGWLAFLEPSSSRNLGFATSLTPFPFGGVVYAPHSYDADAEAGKGFDARRREVLMANIAGLANEAQSLEAALWIGEYGGNADQSGIAEYMDATYDAAGLAAGSTMYWHYGRDDGYGLLRSDGSEKPALLDVLVRPYPERVAGTPLSYEWEEGSRTFTFRYLANPALAAPTELVVPARCYPAGFEVEAAGCTHERTASGVRLWCPAAGPEATVRVRPRP